MKYCVIGLLTVALLSLTACQPLVEEGSESIAVYATFYPIYALTEAVMRDVPDAELHCLVQPQDGCLRSYQLSDWDVRLLSSADAIICGGRGLESFEGALFQWEGGPAVSAVLYNMALMEGTGDSDREDSHLEGVNPHLYMSTAGAGEMVEAIATSLMALDPRYADQYLENEETAEAQLEACRAEMRTAVGETAGKAVVLMNEALNYLADELGLSVADQIDRESGESMDGDELTQCLDRLEKSGSRVILIEKQAPAGLMNALREAGFSVAPIDIFSTHRQGEGFETYLETQLDNARAIARAFEDSGT